MIAAASAEMAAAAADAHERKLAAPEFTRTCVRRRRLKTRLDCGHVIDGTSEYRYAVWKYRGEPIGQRTDCEDCRRDGDRY